MEADRHPIDRWHDLVEHRDPSGLDDLLADDVVFRSPVVHTPQEGRAVTAGYLRAAFDVLLSGDFRYVRDIRGAHDVALEFVVELDGTHVNGVDLVHFDDDGRIDEFTVMLRPLQAVELVHRLMGAQLERAARPDPGTGP
ncbi:nuclear transport factor 2 family protein [Salsipaludibacter albus]|uniref:nuclear transport factor 2 family protein n=1 Tax=Salsipaludibacter albus TaxID=2849650 RepID=UPI001EE47E1E|nr:nuclear transport factor 2 family protein [Salsipaludibacter albus]MBY5162027.1 nuclear transport factor 2 family protein [Salsipaludibacter albus]